MYMPSFFGGLTALGLRLFFPPHFAVHFACFLFTLRILISLLFSVLPAPPLEPGCHFVFTPVSVLIPAILAVL